jgi:MarR family transcriptional regulator, organic hydroperoxide resistance regulator
MTGMLDRLEQAGLLERKAHATDRRVNKVMLAAHGCDRLCCKNDDEAEMT